MFDFTTHLTKNSAGGHAFRVDDWQRLDRFLILGTDGGTYYTRERELTIDNAEVVRRCIALDGSRTIARIVDISSSGRAPKNDPAIFSLAMAAKLGDAPTRHAAYAALPQVCRIGTHLMHFAAHAQAFGGWGRGMRKAVGSWFNTKPAGELALQLAKYQARDGWSNRDLLRLAHPRAASESHDRLFAWTVGGELPVGADGDPACALIVAMHRLRDVEIATGVAIIREHRVPRECVPTEWLTKPEVWDALLDAMPMTALIRNLATMTRVGLLVDGADAVGKVVAQLTDRERLRKARVHPIGVLAALLTYRSGHSARGSGTWTPVASIVEVLDAAFYASFEAVVPTNKRTLLALDVSGSMGCGTVGGTPGLTPRTASAAMALVTAASEPHHAFIGFTAGAGGITNLSISPRQRLDDVVAEVSRHPMGSTDCALPIKWAKSNRVDVDTFVVYTDNETWAGDVQPFQALRDYRSARDIPAKLVVVGMTSTGFSVADPNDAGMLDVVGFDASAPPVIADFARA
jgi:60 kDa SS-A/Ro ribonucleoprotein